MRVGADDWKSPGSLAILASHALPSSFRSRPTPWSVVGRSGDPVRVQPMNRARAATLAFAASVALVIVAVAGDQVTLEFPDQEEPRTFLAEYLEPA